MVWAGAASAYPNATRYAGYAARGAYNIGKAYATNKAYQTLGNYVNKAKGYVNEYLANRKGYTRHAKPGYNVLGTIRGSGRGRMMKGGSKKRKRFSRKFKKSFRRGSRNKRSKKMSYEMRKLVRNMAPPQTARVTNQTGSLGVPNVWSYRMDYFFNMNSSLVGSVGCPMRSLQYCKDVASCLGVTFVAEQQINIESSIDRYIIRAPSNTQTTLEIFVLAPKQVTPDLWSDVTGPCLQGPMYDMTVDNKAASAANIGNITPALVYNKGNGVNTVPAGTGGGTTAYDFGISQLNFHPNMSQRFKANYKIIKQQRFQIGPSDEVTFSVKEGPVTMKYEEFFGTNPSDLVAESAEALCKKSRLVMFRWHGELCQGTGGTSGAGSYCAMGFSGDNLLVRTERYIKFRKVIQNVDTENVFLNKGTTGNVIGQGNNLVTLNANMLEFGEENNAGVVVPN